MFETPPCLSVDLVERQVAVVLANDGVGDLPDLEQVVLCGTADEPGLVGVPAEVCKVVGVTTVHEQAAIMLAIR